MTWKAEEAVRELKMMAERKVETRADSLAYLLRVKLVLAALSIADEFDLQELYREAMRSK